jgi:hypothetical protein
LTAAQWNPSLVNERLLFAIRLHGAGQKSGKRRILALNHPTSHTAALNRCVTEVASACFDQRDALDHAADIVTMGTHS